ncbi:MAG TPA: penicillin acylase family protein [Polyangiaceae bacterium]|nr:penicillin acylase family protein [Polyangiaceae bacterium]
MPSLPGPNGPVSYERDALGYPTIHAADLREGSHALGYLHARDRLVQVTLTALAARGQLMSVLGDVPFARLIDHSTRALGLTVGLAEQVTRCDAESQRLLEAYCAGFERGARARGKPLVLRLLGAPAFECTPEAMLSIFRFISYFGLTSMQVSSELIIAELALRGAPLRVFERLLGAKARGIDLEPLRKLSIPPEFSFFGASPHGSVQAGSNAFAVAGSHSRSGGALLMGEFHMEVGRFPPLLYAAHLALPNDEYLSGITIPGLGWFAAGRTPHVAWSYTFAHADNVDFVVEHVKDGCYLAGSEYRPLERRDEQVAIRRKPSETWTFYRNDYGIVLGDAQAEGDLACVRVSGFAETYRAFSAAHRILACRNVDDLATLQREIKSVSLEAIMADRHGSIGSVVTGQIDQRPASWSGAYPLSSERLENRDPEPVPEARRPLLLRPESGLIASANQGGQGPERDSWCSFPEPPYRFQRISELLRARERHDFESLIAISYDVLDASARRLLAVWGPLLPDHPLARGLRAWAEAQGDRELLQLWNKLHEEVFFALLAADLGQGDARRFREWSAMAYYQDQLDSVLALEHPHLLDEAELRPLLEAAFATALAQYKQHDVPVRLRFKHLVTQGRSPSFLGFDSRPIELPGSPVTPFQCRITPVSGEKLIYAPAFHLLCDMSRPGAWYNLPGGASESRFGPGYGKGIDEWLNGTLLPLGPSGAMPR